MLSDPSSNIFQEDCPSGLRPDSIPCAKDSLEIPCIQQESIEVTAVEKGSVIDREVYGKENSLLSLEKAPVRQPLPTMGYYVICSMCYLNTDGQYLLLLLQYVADIS